MTAVTQQGSRGEFRRLFGYVRPHLPTFLVAVALTALVGGLETVITAMVIPLVDGLKIGSEGLVVAEGAGGVSRLVRSLFPAGPAYWPVLAGALVVITAVKGSAEYAANMLMTSTGLSVVTIPSGRIIVRVHALTWYRLK